MKPFDIAESFLEQHSLGVPLPELRKVFENALQELASVTSLAVPTWIP